jgi:hypothetical protein
MEMRIDGVIESLTSEHWAELTPVHVNPDVPVPASPLPLNVTVADVPVAVLVGLVFESLPTVAPPKDGLPPVALSFFREIVTSWIAVVARFLIDPVIAVAVPPFPLNAVPSSVIVSVPPSSSIVPTETADTGGSKLADRVCAASAAPATTTIELISLGLKTRTLNPPLHLETVLGILSVGAGKRQGNCRIRLM